MDPDYLFAPVLPDLKRWFSSYASLPTTEIEVSFKQLTKEDYDYLDRTLSAYDGWDEVKTSNTIDWTYKGSIRKTLDEVSGKVTLVEKRRIEPPMDMSLGDVTIRFQLKEEIPQPLGSLGPSGFPPSTRLKDRKTFILGKVAYDLTCVNDTSYEFEIECLDGCSADELIGHVLLMSNKLNLFRMNKS